MTEPRVDVLLPTFRRPHTLAAAIRSVLAQSEPRFLLHVVGDGCGPDTVAVVEGFGDPRVRFHAFPKAHGFGYANRNVVLSRTRAPFVAYMTDDDLWFPDHLERGLRALEETPLDLVAFRSGQVRFPDQPDPHFFAFDWRVPWLSAFLRNWFMGSVTSVHRRSVFDVLGYWNDRLSRFGDREFYNRARTGPVRSAYVDCVTVLRFYAQTWDGRYDPERVAPQEAYWHHLQDAAWCDAFRAAAIRGGRGARVRGQQARDFLAFAVKSGPKFVRFGWQQWQSRRRPRS